VHLVSLPNISLTEDGDFGETVSGVSAIIDPASGDDWPAALSITMGSLTSVRRGQMTVDFSSETEILFLWPLRTNIDDR
jgi:hypothetical protein